MKRLIRCAAALMVAVLLVPAFRVVATTSDGQFDAIGALVGGSTFNLTVAGRGGVPGSGVGSVALNVTVTNPTVGGFLTVWPAGADRPQASNLNFVPGQTVPNMVIVPVGANGQVSIFASAGTVDVIVDVLGWFPTGTGFTGLTPARLMDTRGAAPPPPSTSSTTAPTTSSTTQTTAPTSTTSSPSDITPGAFCTPVGAHGTHNGLSYVCSTSNASGVPYSDGRARWRQG